MEIKEKRYAVSVREILKRTVVVEAESIDEAIKKVQDAVDADKLLLDLEDFDERKITPSEYFPCGGEVPDGEDVSFYYHLGEDDD